jgi:hypothetical protein
MCYHTSFQDSVLSGSCVATTSKFMCLPCSYYQLQKIKRYSVWVASVGIILIPDFVKIGQLVQKFKGEHTCIT